MSKNPGMSADAAGMAAAVKSGKLGGIYKEDEKVPALRARKMNSSWWKLIPPGEDAILFLDPENPKGGIPIIVFRNSVRSIPLRLDPALQKAWSVYVQMRTGKLKECSKIPSGVQAEMATSRREAIFTSPPSIIVPPVLCQQTSNGIVPVKSPAIQPVKIRICCLLVPFSRKGSDENIANPANLGIHGTSTEVIGIVYTGRAGFVDLGHLREICDITNSVFDQILSIGGMGRVEIVTTKNNSLTKNTAGFADVTSGVGGTSLTLSSDIRLARAIAFDYGLGHEITSYDDFWMPGGHNSSFSPEDLCSNYLGTLLAERAIMEMRSIGGSYNDIVTNELNKMLKFLDVQSKVESLNAFNRVNHRWIEFNGPQSAINPLIADSYLRRRNFDQVPFKAGHSSDKPTPPFFSTDRLSDQLGRYIYTHIDGKLVNRDDFSTEISRIKADAEKRYGKDFDKP
jgi:hypothetical protein